MAKVKLRKNREPEGGIHSVFKDMKGGHTQYVCFAGNDQTYVGWNRKSA